MPIIKKKNGVLKEVRLFSSGAKTTMKWQFPDHKVHVGPRDDMSPEIIIRNSYDGTVGVNLLAGAFRIVCTNGMVIGVVLDNYKYKLSVYNIELDKLEQSIVDTIEKTKYMFEDEFPTLINTKIKERHIVSYAEEGEPGVFKDRHVMESVPFRLIEGALIAAYATKATSFRLYVNAEAHLSYQRMLNALEICRSKGFLGPNIMGSGCTIDIEILKTTDTIDIQHYRQLRDNHNKIL